MSLILVEAMQRTPSTFFIQIVVLGCWEAANELLTDRAAQHGSRTGIEHAQRVVDIERAHGFFVEPAWQMAALQSHRLFGVTIPWHWQILAANAMYAFGHVIFTTAFALWIFFFRTDLFPFVRNVIIAIDVVALCAYPIYPMAPPRLTPGLFYDGQPYRFIDTSIYWLRTQGDQFAAMPSIHMAYAVAVALVLAWTVRPLPVRLLVLLYPVAMLVTVVVTGNHYIMDGIGALAVLGIAYPVAAAVMWLGGRLHRALFGAGIEQLRGM
jgi:hypothetical protein